MRSYFHIFLPRCGYCLLDKLVLEQIERRWHCLYVGGEGKDGVDHDGDGGGGDGDDDGGDDDDDGGDDGNDGGDDDDGKGVRWWRRKGCL